MDPAHVNHLAACKTWHLVLACRECQQVAALQKTDQAALPSIWISKLSGVYFLEAGQHFMRITQRRGSTVQAPSLPSRRSLAPRQFALVRGAQSLDYLLSAQVSKLAGFALNRKAAIPQRWPAIGDVTCNQGLLAVHAVVYQNLQRLWLTVAVSSRPYTSWQGRSVATEGPRLQRDFGREGSKQPGLRQRTERWRFHVR